MLETLLDFLSLLGSLLVGSVFLVTGVTKALAPRSFFNHVNNLQIFPSQRVIPVALTFIVVEWVLGNALILRLFSNWLFPCVVFLLAALSFLTYWSTSTGRTEDCGCYTQFLEVTSRQSLMLNVSYIVLIVIAIFHPISNFLLPWQQFWILQLAIVVAIFGVTLGNRCLTKFGSPLMTLSPLQANRRWQARWLPTYDGGLMQDTKVVAFLSPNCPHCQLWSKALNIMHKRSDLPDVVGVMAASNEAIEAYIAEKKLAFPVVAMAQSTNDRLIEAYPTVILLEKGTIKENWGHIMPPEFVDQLRTNTKAVQKVTTIGTNLLENNQ